MPHLTYSNAAMLPTMVVANVMLAVCILYCAHFIKKWACMRRSMCLRFGCVRTTRLLTVRANRPVAICA